MGVRSRHGAPAVPHQNQQTHASRASRARGTRSRASHARRRGGCAQLGGLISHQHCRLSTTAFLSPAPRVNFGRRRAAGRGASRQKVLAHLWPHTGSSLRTLPVPAAAVRGPQSVLIHVLFGETLFDPLIHRSRPPARPKSFSKPSEFLGRDYLTLPFALVCIIIYLDRQIISNLD